MSYKLTIVGGGARRRCVVPIPVILFFFSYFIGASFVLAQKLPQAQEPLPQPTININPDIYYPFDEILYIEGRAKPNSSVQIQFSKPGARPKLFGVKSDANGEWVLAEKVPLEAGDWEMHARILDGNRLSEWSNPRIVKVIRTGVTIGGVNIKFAVLVLPILVLFIAGGGVILYFQWRVRILRAALATKEVREAQESVRDGISEIRQDLLDELKLIESSKGSFSADDFARKEHIIRELDQLERNMSREIGDIEKRA